MDFSSETLFDDLVEELLEGEGLVAEFDNGMSISAYDLDKIGITIDQAGSLIDIVISGEAREYLMLFLEAQFAAEANVKSVNWNDLLSGN
jgi:hypothetical protein